MSIGRSALVRLLKAPLPYMAARLRELTDIAQTLRNRSDLLWYLLVQSAATQGNSRGWKAFKERPELLEASSYASVKKCAPNRREDHILDVLRQAKVRMQVIKARWLAANFVRIEGMGGVEGATRTMLGLHGQKDKMTFIKLFDGIGEKYARNIWMDLDDPDFRNSVAVDARLKSISKVLGVESMSYDDAEQFWREVARDAGRSPWELDRLLYNFTADFVRAIDDAGVGATA